MRPLSHLELTVLGLVSKGAPCTPYWIRRQFKESLSSQFSGSAGAVYPAIQRLERRGLVAGVTKARGTREARQYRLSESGETVLRDWLLPPLAVEDVAFAVDPVRTGVFFFGILSLQERLRFVEDALAGSRRFAAEVAADCESQPKDSRSFDYFGARGVLHQVNARIRWLEEVRGMLLADRSDDRST